MTRQYKSWYIAIITGSLLVVNFFLGHAQERIIPRPSSAQTILQQLGTSSLKINYSRPNTKDRKIFGTLVPYGEIWRTGADKLTDITVEKEITFGGKLLPKGRYSLLSIPEKRKWTIIINRQPDLWGDAGYNPADDVFRLAVVPQKLKEKQETMQIGFENVTAFTADLEIRWDKTKIVIPLAINQDKEIEMAIEKAISEGKKPYVEAAIFYLNNGKDLKKPLEWMTLAEKETKDKPYVYYWKAMVEKGLGMKKEALENAITSLRLAEEQGNKDYIRMNNALIKKLK